jgi:hypothetical protein
LLLIVETTGRRPTRLGGMDGLTGREMPRLNPWDRGTRSS